MPDISAPKMEGEKSDKPTQPVRICQLCNANLDSNDISGICPECGNANGGGVQTKVKTAPDPKKSPLQKRIEKGMERAIPRGVPLGRAAQVNNAPVAIPQIEKKPQVVQRPNNVDIKIDPDFLDHETNMDPNHHQNIQDSAWLFGE